MPFSTKKAREWRSSSIFFGMHKQGRKSNGVFFLFFSHAGGKKKEGERVYGEKWRFHENRDSGGGGGMWEEEEEEEEEGNGVARFSFSSPRIIMCEYVRLACSPCLRARPRRCRVAVYTARAICRWNGISRSESRSYTGKEFNTSRHKCWISRPMVHVQF